MSMDESRGSSPSVDVSDSPSPIPSSSHTPTHHACTNGYHNGNADFAGFSCSGPQNHLPAHLQMHPVQSRSPAGMQANSPLGELQFDVFVSVPDDHQFIKRPLNAYMIWTRQERKKILAKDPKMKMNDVSRLMGEKWKTLSDKEKKPFFEMSKQSKLEHKKMGEKWKTLSDKEKKPFFEMSKQSKLEHKKVLKDNPNLVYHPQRKKPLKGTLKGGDTSPPNMDMAPGTPLGSGSGVPPPTLQSAVRSRLNGNSNLSYQQGVPQAQVVAPTPGTVLVAQALGVRTPLHVQSTQQGTSISFTFQTPQSQPSIQRGAYSSSHCSTSAHQNGVVHQSTPATMHQMLDLYYTSLCQPAFPEPGETNSMAPPQYYLDQYQQLHYQAVANQHYSHQTATTGHASYQAI
ncbi:Transcription factor SOX-2 [Toxocara canis]|uniref:Sex-determining region Y protein n=1 Tax=Toxocara canis TaxID=6265 RepID=A0A0B2W0Z4_TOXCA|nr:Transcription factor SOX-2 [Toxocara canis]